MVAAKKEDAAMQDLLPAATLSPLPIMSAIVSLPPPSRSRSPSTFETTPTRRRKRSRPAEMTVESNRLLPVSMSWNSAAATR